MANTIPFEKLVKYQMKRFKECNHKFKSPKTNEDENTKSHNYALVSEIQCLVSNLLQFVKIIKHATSIADGSLCKRERKAEDLLAGLMQNMDQMKNRLSQYQEKVCIPRLQAKQIHLQKQQDEMAYILDCLCKGNSESLTRFAIDSSDVIKSRIENLSATGKDIGILQGEVSHLTSDVNDIVDIVKDLITTVTSSGVSPRSSEIGLFMRRLASHSRDGPASDACDTSSTSPCSVELADEIKGEVTQSTRMRADQIMERRTLPCKLVSESSLGTALLSNDDAVSPPAVTDPPRVQCSDSAVNQKLQLGTGNSAFTPTAKRVVSPGGHTNQPEANFKNQLDILALSRTSGSGEQAFSNECTSGQSTEASREQEGRKAFAFGDSPVSFVTALQGGAVTSIEEEEVAHATLVKTVVAVETPNLPVADANSQTFASEILSQGSPLHGEHQELLVYSVLTSITQSKPEDTKKSRWTPTESEQNEMPTENEDFEVSRIVPEENQEGRTPSNTPTGTEEGRDSRTTPVETEGETQEGEFASETPTGTDEGKTEDEELKSSSKTVVDAEDKKSSPSVTDTQEVEKSEGTEERTSVRMGNESSAKADDSEACPTPPTLSLPPSTRPSPQAKSRCLSESNTEDTSMTSVMSTDGPVEDPSTYSSQGDMEVISAVTKERIKGIQNLIGVNDMRELQRLGFQNTPVTRAPPRLRDYRVNPRNVSRPFHKGFTIFAIIITFLVCLHFVMESNLFSEFGAFEQFLSSIIQFRPQAKALY